VTAPAKVAYAATGKFFIYFRLMKFASENQEMSVKNCGVFEERSDEFPQFSE
jgi:hypothetical protein